MPTEDIIACYLGTDATTTLIGFEKAHGWIVIDRFDDTPDADDFERFSSTVLDWAETTYRPDAFVVLDTETDTDLTEVLPGHPIGKADLPTLETLPGIERVHPIFCYADTHEIIALLTFQTKSGDPESFTMTNYAYDPEQQYWNQIERAAIGPAEDIEPAEDIDIHQWIEAHYDMDEVVAVSPAPLDEL